MAEFNRPPATVKFRPPPLLQQSEVVYVGSGVDLPSSSTYAYAEGPVRSDSKDGGSIKTPTTPGPTGTRDSAQYDNFAARNKRDKKVGHRRIDKETGEVTYKRMPSSTIVGSIQLAIANSVGSLASKPERDLLMQDFSVVDSVYFPSDGGDKTPSHPYSDFRFKTYAPIAFRYFRDLFRIQPEDFLFSICNEPLRELSNPGASGSIFFMTSDDQFIIKTIQHKEADFLQKLLPGYYMNLQQNSRTLLPKFFGLYCYQVVSKNIRLCVMNNLLPSTIKMQQKYDLKGSTYKRQASKKERTKSCPTLKDLDFLEDHPEGIYLEAAHYDALMKTISRDCLVLESFKIMDYSMLMGIHNIDQAVKEREEGIVETGEGPSGLTDIPQSESVESSNGHFISSGPSTKKPEPSQRKITRNKSLFTSAMESIQVDVAPVDLGEEYPTGGIPARNVKGERLLIFLGIIDILQSYRLFKKLEHTWKSVLHDGDTISVHRPSFYAQRFQDFMRLKVFRKIPSLDLPEVRGPHHKFRTLVATILAIKHSPSKKKRDGRRGTVGSDGKEPKRSGANPTEVVSARPDLVPTTSEDRQDAGSNSPPPPGSDGHHVKRASVRRLTYDDQRRKSVTLPRQDATVDFPETTKEKKVERLFASTKNADERPRLTSNESTEESEPVSAKHVQIGEMTRL